MSTNIGSWLPVEVQSSKGMYAKYKNQEVVMVSKGDVKNRKVYITKKVYEKLGKPKEVAIFERGSNMAIANADNIVNSRNKLVVQWTEGIDYYCWINANQMSKGRNIQQGVYDIHWESEMVVFDTASKPTLP